MFHRVLMDAFCFAKMPGIIRLRPAIAGLRRDKPIPLQLTTRLRRDYGVAG